ncbi:amino acid permease [Aneurinibacillus tyrosinisolvens]|uniref:amino acid permease n=1 Tax=Aneurinibacillus tyrosinisolvens TaxID=1443435 RepID=UPI00063EEF89|nr:amino acid permease [Aneurinibacillus tyrosinisolvens]
MSKESAHKGSLSWWQLALLGFGCITGTGFFLGSGIAIERSGFSVLLVFLLAAIGTYFVFDALANMIAQDTQKGSFCTYSKKAFGHWAGFSHGWIYWTAEMLILGSQLTALGLFTRFWLPHTPLWVFTAAYAALGIGVVLLGTKGFEKAENILAVVKIAAIVMFIILAFLVFTGVLGEHNAHMHKPTQMNHFLSHGITGLWSGLIYVFFAFAGIEVMGLMAAKLHDPKEAPKIGKVVLSVITALFILSIGLALLLAPLEDFTSEESPFVIALRDLNFTVIVHIFNGVLIIAGFSSLVASLYSVTQMMYMIAKDGDAPKIFTKISKRKIPYGSLGLTICGMIVSIVIALLLPKEVYEYITTAGGLMLLYAWLFMVSASRKLLKLSAWGHLKTITAMILVLLAASGTLFDKTSRLGFYVSLLFLVIIGVVTLIMKRKWKKAETDQDQGLWRPLKKQ